VRFACCFNQRHLIIRGKKEGRSLLSFPAKRGRKGGITGSLTRSAEGGRGGEEPAPLCCRSVPERKGKKGKPRQANHPHRKKEGGGAYSSLWAELKKKSRPYLSPPSLGGGGGGREGVFSFSSLVRKKGGMLRPLSPFAYRTEEGGRRKAASICLPVLPCRKEKGKGKGWDFSFLPPSLPFPLRGGKGVEEEKRDGHFLSVSPLS